MGKIKKYENIILELLKDYIYPPNVLDKTTTHLIVDHEHHHYQILTEGWVKDDDYMMNITMHLHIKSDEKIWILANWTEDDIAQMLVDRGVLKTDIVLGLLPVGVRSHTGYAVA